MNFLLVFSFIGIVSAIALVSKYLVYFLIGIEEKTKYNKSFIGIFLLALSTSLPEGISAITAPIISDPLLTFNNIIGANFLTIAFLALFALLWKKKEILTVFNKENKLSLLILICVNSLFLIIFFYKIDFLFFNASFWLWIYFILYFVFIYLISKNVKAPEKIKNEFKYKKNTAIIGFLFMALLMIFLAMMAVYITDQMALPQSQGGLNLGITLGGKLFLSLATAIPEILTLFWLLKKNNVIIGFSGIVGSNILNLSFFFFTDIIIGAKSFIRIIPQSQIIFSFAPIIVCYILLYLLQIRTNKSKKNINFLTKFSSILIIILYFFMLWN